MVTCRYPSNTALTGYAYGCRCDRCTEANRAYYRAWITAERARLEAIGPVHGPRRPRKPTPPRPRTLPYDRVVARVVVDAAGCWLWQGAIRGNGYGAVRVPGRGVVGVHRVTYEHAHGPIPAGYHVDHLCAVRRCCNPGHLEAVTPVENDRRARARLAA